MYFPGQSTGNAGKPWARLDARTGMMVLSAPGGEKKMVDLSGKTLSVNVLGAQQGWLKVDGSGADWQPVPRDQWGVPPSPEHKPGVECEIYCADGTFGDAPVRVARGNSKGWTSFIGGIVQNAGSIPAGTWPTIKVNKVSVIKIGQGTSISVDSTMAPREKWAKDDAVRAAGNAAAAGFAGGPTPAAKGATKDPFEF
ncbi:MAG: hypothetical protein JSW09_07315 [Pseudomonadota bacterium]|nr:MAG: hypothetical protein JSW09_07315 [Pseudomonadota bacterium]